MAWTCSNCGTKNEGGLFNFCKKCGSTPSREPSAAPREPTARQPKRQPQVVQSTWQQSSGRRRRKGSGAFMVVLLLVLVAAGAVVALASRVDLEDTLRDLTAADDPPSVSVDTEGILDGFTDDLFGTDTLAETAPPAETTSPPESSEPTVTAPVVAPDLTVIRKRDARCAARWNGKQNARARRAIVAAAEGEPQWAGVQLTAASSTNSVQSGVCVIIFGTQPDRTQPVLRPGDVYAEAGPASGPRLPFVRLASVSLSYAWNARVRQDGVILPKSAP